MEEGEEKNVHSSEDEIYDEECIEKLEQIEEANQEEQSHYPDGSTGGNPSKRSLNKVLLNHLKQNKANESSNDQKVEEQKSKNIDDKPSDASGFPDQCDLEHIKEILKGFNPNEFIPKQSGYEKFQLCMLRTKSSIPMIVTVSLIQFVGLTYLFTYCLPLVFDDYNNTLDFFYKDVHRIEGIRKAPHWIRISILVFSIFLYLIVNISLFRAINTSAGSLPAEDEWDIRDEVLNICKRKNQLSESPLDLNLNGALLKPDEVKSTKNAIRYLEKASQEKYFGMNMLAVDVDYQLFSNGNSPCVIVKGVEENLARRFHNKYQEISKIKAPKSIKTEEIKHRQKDSEESIPLDPEKKDEEEINKKEEQRKANNENSKEDVNDETEQEYSEADSLMSNKSHDSSLKSASGRRNIFPIFKRIYEVKSDGNARICIRCLKSKPDRCHHCSICNQCVRKMDHHCPWLNNCIGFNNYKFFFNTIFYCMISCILSLVTYWEVWAKMLEDEDTNIVLLYTCTVYYFLVVIFCVVITCFTLFHVRLMVTNYTTLEYCEKRKENVSTWQISPYYSTSWKYNVSNFLGFDFFLLWFFPIAPTQISSNGFAFTVFDEEKMKEKLQHAKSEDSQQKL